MDKIKYRKAEEMKDSGIEWLGMIPKDIDETKIKYVAEINGRIGFRGYTVNDIVEEGSGAITLSPSNIINNKLELTKRTYISWKKYFESPEIQVKNGDVLLVKTASIGKVAYVENLKECATINPQFVVFKDIKFIPKLFYYLVKSKIIQEQVRYVSNGGVVSTLTQSDIGNFVIPKFTFNEQQKIADFLDLKTAQLDSIISKKQVLIEKLEEAKKSLITEVVTGKVKIVDGQMIRRKPEEMKDSGIEWLGMIPKEWEVTQINRLFRIKKKPIFKQNNIVLSLTQRGLKIKDLDNNEGQHALTYSGYQEVLANDFVMNHMDLLTGYVDCSSFEGVTSPDYRVFQNRDNTKISNMFYLYFFQMCYKNKIFYGYGQGVSNFGRWRLQTATFQYFPIIQLNYTEQIMLTNYLNCRLNLFSDLIDKTKTQIQKLEEAKQSLISEVVTGKIDLRDWEIVEGDEIV